MFLLHDSANATMLSLLQSYVASRFMRRGALVFSDALAGWLAAYFAVEVTTAQSSRAVQRT